MNNERPSPNAQAAGETEGHGASSHDEKAVQAAHKATAVAKQRVARKPKATGGKGGWIRNTFGTDNQLWNILAMVVAVLLLMLLIAEVFALLKDKQDSFLFRWIRINTLEPDNIWPLPHDALSLFDAGTLGREISIRIKWLWF